MPGYPKAIFTDGRKLHDRLLCVICKLVLKNAVQLTCGHRFCDSCVKEKLENSTSDNGALPRCPACTSPDSEESVFKEGQIYPDFHARKELKNLRVKCINEGCQWSGTFNKYSSEHEAECEFESIKCLKAGCGKTLRRADLAYHLEKDCPMRPVRCRHCGEETVCKNMKKHNAECLKTPVTCRDCGEKMLRELLRSHQDIRDGNCPKRSRQCPFANLGCTFKISPGDAGLNEHLQNELVYHTQLQIDRVEDMLEQGKSWLESQSVIANLQSEASAAEGESAAGSEEGACANPKGDSSKLSSTQVNQLLPMFQQMFVTRAEQSGDSTRNSGKSMGTADREAVDRKIRELESKVKAGEEELGKMRTLYAVLDKRNETFQEVVAVLNNQLEVVVEKSNALERENRHLHDTIEQQEKQIHAHDQMLTVKNVALAEQDLRIQALEASAYNGILVWKVTEFARRRSEAISGKTTSFYSQPFYTSYHGYKMRARIYLNGDGMGKGTHVSLFFVVMKGRYDNILRWPFRQKVTFMMVDQGNREHVVDSFRPDPTSSSFKKPTHEMNIASGCPMFLNLNLFDSNNHQYVKDDCLFVKVIVDVSDLERI